jgi:nitroreductase
MADLVHEARTREDRRVELRDALRTTGAIREFTDEPVPDETILRVLETARFAPSGGNRQAWRVVVLQDPAVRTGLRELYTPVWYDYLAIGAAGMVPWAPITDRSAERDAIESGAAGFAADAAAGPGGFAEHFDQVPVLLAVLADLRALAAVDRDLDRYTLAGGASIYPFVWSVLLAARDEGLGGVVTTMVIRREPEVRALLGIPDELAVAAVVALGHPVRQTRKLTRRPVGEFTTVDRFDGEPFGG